VTDWLTTLLAAAAVAPPGDRVIDGVDQLGWLAADQESAARDGYVFWNGPELYGVKWRNFKLALVCQWYSSDLVGRLASPHIINLIADPQEREPLNLPDLHSWTATHFNRLLGEFHASVARERLIPSGAALDFVPGSG
jgi:arylsulfatase